MPTEHLKAATARVDLASVDSPPALYFTQIGYTSS